MSLENRIPSAPVELNSQLKKLVGDDEELLSLTRFTIKQLLFDKTITDDKISLGRFIISDPPSLSRIVRAGKILLMLKLHSEVLSSVEL